MAVKMPLGLRIAIIDWAFRRKMDEWEKKSELLLSSFGY